MLREAHEGGMGACLYHSPDREGSTDVITDGSGNIVWDGDYEAFGSVARSNGTIGFTPSYTGKEYDVDTGLYYYNARWHDPTLGRFITEDPARSGGNWYEYGSDNPLTHIDPTGLYDPLDKTTHDTAHLAAAGIKPSAAVSRTALAAPSTHNSPIDPKLIPKKAEGGLESSLSSPIEAGTSSKTENGSFKQGYFKAGPDTAPGSANYSFEATALSDETRVFSAGPVEITASKSLGKAEGFLGLKDGNTAGASAGIKLASLGLEIKIDTGGSSLLLGGSVDFGTVEAGLKATSTLAEGKLGAGLIGGSIKIGVKPNGSE